MAKRLKDPIIFVGGAYEAPLERDDIGGRMIRHLDPPFVCAGSAAPYQHFQQDSGARSTYRFIGHCHEIYPLHHAHPGPRHGHL